MNLLKKLLEGYGSFFALNTPLSKALIFICAMLQPTSGILGLLGGLSVLLSHRLLQFQADNERIEVVNGILFGMLIGSLYMPGQTSAVLTVCGGLMVALVGALLSDTLRHARLPLLGLPYALVSFVMLPVAAWLKMPLAPLAQHYTLPLPEYLSSLLYPLGAIYFNGTALGGVLVLLGFLISSRYLACTALAASAFSYAYLNLLGVSSHSTVFLIAQMNGVLTASVIGSLYAVPGKRSIVVALMASVLTCTLALCLARLMWICSLPVLALPFVLVTYACLIIFTAQRGRQWAYFWLPVPSLPERSLEQLMMSRTRGIDSRSVALRLPFNGTWQVYQGFEGSHTHQGQWRYALDFFQALKKCSFSGSGAQLTDFHCYGKPVLSPAYGTVVVCRADLPDNRPGEVDCQNNWGNHILLRLDCGSYVMLAHLQRNSIKVQPGYRVHPGMPLASVGNSGRSPQPHLHMHVQETPVPGSRTIPFHLTGVVINKGQDQTYSLSAVPAETDCVSLPTNNGALRRALRLNVGTTFELEVTDRAETKSKRKFEIKLDIYGQFWLESDSGATVAFTSNEEFLAFYGRTGPQDEVLDALILSLGLTPMTEGSLKWSDLVPARMLPLSRLAKAGAALCHPINPCAQSRYERQWEPVQQVWIQTAEHKLGFWQVTTEARLCEANGLLEFSVSEGGRKALRATVVSVGILEDNGIPAVNLAGATPINQCKVSAA